MKIEIEFTSSYSATLTIDGREMKVETGGGCTRLLGIKEPDTENTLGGIIASDLFSHVHNYMQAWAEAEEIDVDTCTWDELSEDAAGMAQDRIW